MNSIIILLLASYVHGQGLIGYDCGSPHSNITTISLLDVGECELPDYNPQIVPVYIQLLQHSRYQDTPVLQCKVVIQRTLYYCGMHSHVSIVSNGQAEYVTDITKDQCKEMHKTGTLHLGFRNMIRGLQLNQTHTRPVTLAGNINTDGKCSGAEYSDPYGSWSNVVAQGIVTISLETYGATVNLESDRVHLRSGTSCQYSAETCIDVQGGHTFWETIRDDYCRFREYDVLYEGEAKRLMDESYEQGQLVYTLATKDITFALTRKGEETLSEKWPKPATASDSWSKWTKFGLHHGTSTGCAPIVTGRKATYTRS